VIPLLLAVWVHGRPAVAETVLPPRIRRIVLHVPGGPSYARPEQRWLFFKPEQTLALWKPHFGTHWILATDGSLWPRHPRVGEPASAPLPVTASADAEWRQKLAREAEPVYSHVYGDNPHSCGIEISHSGRSQDPFPPEQVRALAWLLRTLIGMSEGRLTPASVVGHKDLDRRPAYASEDCERSGCPLFADAEGRPYRRRLDPPGSLFAALVAEGFEVPRRPSGEDAELLRAEALPSGARPRRVSR